MYQILSENYNDGTEVNGTENSEEIIWQRDPKIVNYNWTKEATRLLIGLRTTLDSEFDDPNQRKMDLWERIAGVLSDHGFDFPPSICDKKWRNLLVSFRRTISRGTQGKINRFPYTWEFYNDLFEYWKKKDPAGFEPFEMEQNGGTYGGEEGEDMEGEDGDQAEYDEDQDDGEGDMNKFLTVTLSDSEGECEGQESFGDDLTPPAEDEAETEEAKPKPSKLFPPYPTLQSSSLITVQPAAASVSPGPLVANRYLSQLTASARPRPVIFSRVLRPTVTIEEVTPKRTHLEHEQNDEVPFKLSTASGGLNISLREAGEEGYGVKRARREGDRDDLCPPAWFSNHIKEAEEREQKRWEEEKALRLRELELRRDLDLKKIQAMNRLTAALGSFVQRTNPSRPSSS